MGFKDFLKNIGVYPAEDEPMDYEPAGAEPAGRQRHTVSQDTQPISPVDISKYNNVRQAGASRTHITGNTATASAGTGSEKIVDIAAGKSHIKEGAGEAVMPNMKVVVIQPKSLDDSQQIANCLKEKRPVVINFEGVDDQLYRRILDFVSGTTYALDGNVNSISTRVWLFSPKNVNVSVNKKTNNGYNDMPWEKKE